MRPAEVDLLDRRRRPRPASVLGWEPQVAFPELVAMMVDADLAAAAGAATGDDVRRAFVTGVSGQDGSYLAERLLADGRRGARASSATPTARPRALPARGGRCTRATSPTSTGSAALLARRRTRRDLQPGRASARSPARGRSPTSTARRQRARPRVGLLRVGAAGCRSGTAGRCAFVQASSAEIFGEPDRVSPQDEATPIRPVNPYGAAKAYAHHVVGRLPRAAACTRSALILYNHESPRRPDQLRHPQDHRDASPRSPAAGPTSSRSATSTPAATGAGPRTTSTRWCAPPAPTAPTTTWSPPASATPSRDFVAAAFARAGIDDWEPLRRGRPGLRPPGRRRRPRRRRRAGPRATSAGRRPSTSRSSSAGWSTPTCATQLGTRPTPGPGRSDVVTGFASALVEQLEQVACRSRS